MLAVNVVGVLVCRVGGVFDRLQSESGGICWNLSSRGHHFSLLRVMLTSPSIPPLTAVVYSYKVHVFVATFQRVFDSNIPPPLPVSPARASTPFCNSIALPMNCCLVAVVVYLGMLMDSNE